MDPHHKQQTYFLLIATTVIWGVQPLCIKWVLAAWSPVTITAMRYLLIGSILLAMVRAGGRRVRPRGREWWYLLGMGLTGIMINNVLQFTGLQLSTVTNCTLISAASPAITALMAAVFIRERLNLAAWLGILISFVGALLVVSGGSWQAVLRLDFNPGDMLFLISQVAWTVYSLLGLRVMGELSAAAATGWAGLFGALLTLLYGSVTGSFQLAEMSWGLWMAFLYTVVFGGVMAMLFWNIGVRDIGPSLTSIFQNITPVVGMAGGLLLFAEDIGLVQLGGALAIFLGVYLTTHSDQLAKCWGKATDA